MALMEAPKLAYGCMILTFLSRNSLQKKATHHESLDIFISSPGTIVLRHGELAMP